MNYKISQDINLIINFQIYLTITPADKSEEIFKNLMTKINEVENESDFALKEALFDIARAMSIYQSEEIIKELFSKLLPLCESSADKGKKVKNNLQKKGFKIIEDILKSDKQGCKEFVKNNRKQIQSVVMNSLNTSADNSRASRLRFV